MTLIVRSSGGAWRKSRDTIDATTAKAIDEVPLGSFHSLDYIITLSNVAEAAARKVHFSILKDDGGLKDAVYGKMGSLKFKISAVINGSNCDIIVTNDESFAVSVSIAKLVLA